MERRKGRRNEGVREEGKRIGNIKERKEGETGEKKGQENKEREKEILKVEKEKKGGTLKRNTRKNTE